MSGLAEEHHTEPDHVDCELPSQKLQTPLNPILAAVEVVAADRVFSAENRPAARAIDAMVDTSSTSVDRIVAVLASRRGTSGLGFVLRRNPANDRRIPESRTYK